MASKLLLPGHVTLLEASFVGHGEPLPCPESALVRGICSAWEGA